MNIDDSDNVTYLPPPKVDPEQANAMDADRLSQWFETTEWKG